MTNMMSRRTSLSAIAGLLVLSFALPVPGFAGQSASNTLKGEQGTSKARPASDQIKVGPCLPGHADYNPEKCREEIKK